MSADHVTRSGQLRQWAGAYVIAFQSAVAGRIGALLIEPVLIGAGGMVLVDPLFQAVLVRACKARGIPVVYDEIFVGLYRLGVQSTRELVRPKAASGHICIAITPELDKR